MLEDTEIIMVDKVEVSERDMLEEGMETIPHHMEQTLGLEE
jgi:hypothetical protein